MKTNPGDSPCLHMHPLEGPSVLVRGFTFRAKAAPEGPSWGWAKREQGSREDLAALHALFTPFMFYLHGMDSSIL